MVCIKSKIILHFLIILFTINLIIIISDYSIKADEKIAHLVFEKEPTYELIKEFTSGEEIVGWSYEIDIYIKNIGTKRSYETMVNITDQEGFTLSNNTFFEPGESKMISFTWSTTYNSNQELIIKYSPADRGISPNDYNSATTSLKIGKNQQGLPAAATPGFEIIILILAIILITLQIKIKNKKN